jgi:hypothetical protein
MMNSIDALPNWNGLWEKRKLLIRRRSTRRTTEAGEPREATCEQVNTKDGLSDRDVDEIICSSMRAQNTG